MADAEDPSKKYDQAFFLDLATQGKDAWNAWRRNPANKDMHVTFAGIDFSEAPRDQIDFSGFNFCDYADFSRCPWRGAKWAEIKEDSHAFRPGRACFTGTVFGRGANFTGAAFNHGAHFTRAAFGPWANFTVAAFDDHANFAGAAFGDDANFTGAAFGDDANFTGTAFDWGANFSGVTFSRLARFNGVIFKGLVTFTGKFAEELAREFASTHKMDEEACKALEKRLKEAGSRPDRFGPLTIDAEVKKFLFCLQDTSCLPIPRKVFNYWWLGRTSFRSPSCFSSASRCAIISRSSEHRLWKHHRSFNYRHGE
jgi:hypothetical protein